MKSSFILSLLIIVCPAICFGQASGNVSYSQASGHSKADQNERNKRAVTNYDVPPSPTSLFVDASVLMNVKADEHVAIFAVMQECVSVPECSQKMDATVTSFTRELKQLGIGDADIFVDFATQNKIYGYQVAGDIAKEKLVGFELKKNISIHYKDQALLDKLVLAASKSNVFDLIKVDYIVKDAESIQNKLMTEASAVIKTKVARYERLFGIKVQPIVQVYAEKPSIYYPTEMYDSYAAFESEEMSSNYYREKYMVQGARKSRTFFFNGLNADGFDAVINPITIEPVVQFTLYLKVKYEIDAPKK